MSYIYFFLIIFILLYALLVKKDDFFKFNIKIIIVGLVSVSSLLVYENILSDGSLELAYQKQSLLSLIHISEPTRLGFLENFIRRFTIDLVMIWTGK